MKPNILFLFTDDQRFDTIRALGNEEIHTPNLDMLVANGTAFTHAHIPGGTSAAVCMPSRAMLHTGRILFHLDDMGQKIPENHTMLGECFQSAGYDVFGTGKWHNSSESYARSFNCGDEIFFGGMEDHWNVPANHFDPTGVYAGQPIVREPWTSNEVIYRQCDHISPGTHSTDLFADAALRFLQTRSGEKPFMLYISLMAPHDPRTMPREYLDRYDADSVRLPENFQPEHTIDTGALQIRDEVLAGFPRNPEEIKRHIAEYYAMITHLDDALGRLLAQLEQSGEIDNTLIVFAGDNGLALGQHGLMGKQNLYDHSVRVPLIFSGPGIPRGERRDGLVYLLDIYPTLCEFAGIDTPESVEGRSLLPYLQDISAAPRENLYLAYVDSIRGVTDGRRKLIEYAGGETQLFDLVSDPLETHNLADVPEHAQELKDARTRLAKLRDEWEDDKHWTGKTFWSRREDIGAYS